MQWIEFADGLRARVAPGAGEKVLWIHGYTLDSSTWAPLWERLPGWHHIGVDLPGHGQSRPFSAEDTLPSLARTIGQAALDHGVRHVVALSFGGVFALQIALEFPTAFAGFVLGAPGFNGGISDPYVGRLYRRLGELYFRRGPGPWMTELWMNERPYLFQGAAHQPALWAQLEALVQRHTWDEFAGGALVRIMRHAQSFDDLAAVQSDTVVIVGTDEMPAFQRIAELLAAHLPRGRRVVLPDVSHLCLLQQPDVAAQQIAAHLTANAVLAAGAAR